MSLPRWLARMNRHVANPVLGRLVGLPGFVLLEHRGRRTGRFSRTPVFVFRCEGGVVVALTYGAESDWVRNVVEAGEAVMSGRGWTVRLSSPRLLEMGEAAPCFPLPIRVALRLIGVRHALRMEPE